MDLVVDPGCMSRLDVFVGDDASMESVAISATENLGARSELEEGGRGNGVDDRCNWSQDGCSSWHAPHRQRQWWWHLIQVGSSSIGLISWPRDACHVVRKMHHALCI